MGTQEKFKKQRFTKREYKVQQNKIADHQDVKMYLSQTSFLTQIL